MSPTKVRAVDANVILRFLLNDDSHKASRTNALFRRVRDGEERIEITLLMLADVVWTLQSYYKVPRERIREHLTPLLIHPNVLIDHKTQILDALTLFARENIDFSDALMVVEMRDKGLSELYSYDRDFDRFDDLQRIEP